MIIIEGHQRAERHHAIAGTQGEHRLIANSRVVLHFDDRIARRNHRSGDVIHFSARYFLFIQRQAVTMVRTDVRHHRISGGIRRHVCLTAHCHIADARRFDQRRTLAKKA